MAQLLPTPTKSSTKKNEVSSLVAVNPSFDGVYTLIDPPPAPKRGGAQQQASVSKGNVAALVIAVLIVILLLVLTTLCVFILLELKTAPLTPELRNPTSTTSSLSDSIKLLNSSVTALNQLLLNGWFTQNKECIAKQLNSSIADLIPQLFQELDFMEFEMEPTLELLSTHNDQALNNLEKQLNSSTETLERLLTHENKSNISFEEFLNSTMNDLYQQHQQLAQKLSISLYDQIMQILGSGQFPTLPTSCAALPPSSPSGYYWVTSFYGSAVRVYCDMTRSCGGVTGGWTRVFELDMTNSSQQCPSGLRQRNDSNLRTCSQVTGENGCSQVILPTSRLQYSRVCGRIKAYQVGTTDAFGTVYTGRQLVLGIDDAYVDGVSFTHGNPRQHIWTFAAGHDENGRYPQGNCPCMNNGAAIPPSFVGNDYFCDTGSSNTAQRGFFYSSDPLWDGAGCGPLNTCCSFNTPPWFYKQLPQPTTDDIEVRVCRDQISYDEDVALEKINIYIQ